MLWGHRSGLGNPVLYPGLSCCVEQSFQIANTYPGRQLNLPKVTKNNLWQSKCFHSCLSGVVLIPVFTSKDASTPFLWRNKLSDTHISSVNTSDHTKQLSFNYDSTEVQLQQREFFVFSQVLMDWRFFCSLLICTVCMQNIKDNMFAM